MINRVGAMPSKGTAVYFEIKKNEVTETVLPIIKAYTGTVKSSKKEFSVLDLTDNDLYVIFLHLFDCLDHQTMLDLASVCRRWSHGIMGFYQSNELRLLEGMIKICMPSCEEALNKAASEKITTAQTLHDLERTVISFVSEDLKINEMTLSELYSLQTRLREKAFPNYLMAYICQLIIGKLQMDYMTEGPNILNLCGLMGQIFRLLSFKHYSLAIDEWDSVIGIDKGFVSIFTDVILKMKNLDKAFDLMERLKIEAVRFSEIIVSKQKDLLVRFMELGQIREVIKQLEKLKVDWCNNFSEYCFWRCSLKNFEFISVTENKIIKLHQLKSICLLEIGHNKIHTMNQIIQCLAKITVSKFEHPVILELHLRLCHDILKTCMDLKFFPDLKYLKIFIDHYLGLEKINREDFQYYFHREALLALYAKVQAIWRIPSSSKTEEITKANAAWDLQRPIKLLLSRYK